MASKPPPLPARMAAGLLFVGAALALPGCQGCDRPPDLAEVEGTVTGPDGKPLPKVKVVFFPDAEAKTVGPESVGYTDAGGHYRVRFDDGRPGAVLGKHRVCLVDKESLDPGGGRVARAYAGVATTPLRNVEVKAGAQVHDFKVPRNTVAAGGPKRPVPAAAGSKAGSPAVEKFKALEKAGKAGR